MFCGQIDFRAHHPGDCVARMLAHATSVREDPEIWADAPARFGLRPLFVDDADPAGEAIAIDHEAQLAAIGDVRLDNREDLRRELDAPAGSTDLALVLALYRKSSRAGLDRLYGDYAFVIWDAPAVTAICMRDHIGIAPFYYAWHDRHLVFSSELEVLALGSDMPRVPDRASVADFLDDMSKLPLDRTLLRGLRRLPGAHRMAVDADGPKVARWWFPQRCAPLRMSSDADYAQGLRERLEDAVRARIPRHDAIGAHLTGGLDSSSVATIAARDLRAQGRPAPRCFAWQPPPASGSSELGHEHRIIESMARADGFDVGYVAPEARDFVECLSIDPFVRPYDSALTHELGVMRAAQDNGIRVILSGWGGDECVSFNGRGTLGALLLTGRFAQFAQTARLVGRNPIRAAAATLKEIALASTTDAASFLPGRSARGFRNRSFSPWHMRGGPPTIERRPLRVRVALLERGHIQSRIECWADSGARHGIAYRYPLLDRRLLEYALGLPIEQFRRGKTNRYVMRNAVSTILPEDIAWNPDKSEPVRVERYIGALTKAMDEIGALPAFTEPNPVTEKFVDMSRVEAALHAGTQAIPGKRPPWIFGASRAVQLLGARAV